MEFDYLVSKRKRGGKRGERREGRGGEEKKRRGGEGDRLREGLYNLRTLMPFRISLIILTLCWPLVLQRNVQYMKLSQH